MSDDKSIIRYIQGWKYEDIMLNGFSFVNSAVQSDDNDCSILDDISGFARFNNNKKGIKSKQYISCWKIIDSPSINDFKNYCIDDYENGVEISYALKSTISKISLFCQKHCENKNEDKIYYNHGEHFEFSHGKVKYIKTREYKMQKNEKIFSKKSFYKESKFREENEYRFLLYPIGGVAVPDKKGNYELVNNDIKVVYMHGMVYEFVNDLYMINWKTMQISKSTPELFKND